MNKIILASCLMLAFTSCTSMTKNSTLIDFRDTSHKNSSDLFFPSLDDPAWAEVNTYQTILPKILLTSIYQADNNSKSYYLNIPSAEGFQNLTAETIDCKKKSYVVVAIGDPIAKNWIKPETTTSTPIDLNLNSNDIIRRTIYSKFCKNVFPKTPSGFRKRLAQ